MSGKRILVVDDEAPNREVLEGMLEALGHRCEHARDGAEALAKVHLGVDLVLLDVMLPGMDGFEVARQIRRHPKVAGLPIVMVTALDGREARLQAVEAGANDFIAKPVDPTELRVRVESQLRLKEATDELRCHHLELELKIEERTSALRSALDEMVVAQRRIRDAHLDTIHRLVLAAEYKDRDTASHIRRISEYSALLARALGLPASEVELLRHASPMHDVGKIGIPDAVLLKPGRLTAAERKIVEGHTVIGARILRGSPSELLQAGEIIALTHHERWDGEGYPEGLSGDGIPLWGRICAVADFFDALTTDRPYRQAFSNQETWAMMAEERGRHFDPRLLDLFVARRGEVEEVQDRFRDAGEDRRSSAQVGSGGSGAP